MGKKSWFTNDKIQVLRETCPEGFHPGRLPVSDETRRKHSENNGMKNVSHERLMEIINKGKATKANWTQEQRDNYSQTLSRARKGKCTGATPWNKGKKGAQIAWNKGLKMSDEFCERVKKGKAAMTDEEKQNAETKRYNNRIYGAPWNKGLKLAPLSEETKLKISLAWADKSEEEIREIIKRRSWHKYLYNNLYFDSSWELYYYIWNTDRSNSIIRLPLILTYEFEGVTHRYLPDFLVNGQLIEIKGD